ncbi:MAG: ActS/PrrB/RegB family redox-sensitive histidine kinase [Alphaproteobacteria bacterium]|nr:ActS/PrrB/RegB family redox-sensitive histidine kinase [Alphaproteobacteria bacterium]MBU0798305.1 ActS/PrrB/RegB family redox-sensitive histidine kinase [Alphaproteobacteria bacterium]MBU0886419.1 ActS/PrrB/RegB family redox-sensitive histidine kinase [Alphaproteobacteria bacterium]MBU1813385.1 ActS/PrrB/RegB family redox-sensitive histidine kinase [Alphaproteobacteria bacterium]
MSLPSAAPASPDGILTPYELTHPVRLHTLVLLRWVAVIGQGGTLLATHLWLGFDLPMALALGIVGLSVLLNLSVSLRRPSTARLTDREAALFLGFDILQLSVLLFITGGLTNPFSLLILAPVTVAATILSARSTIGLCVFSLACLSLLAFFHLPLPSAIGGSQTLFDLPPTYVLGIWAGLWISTIFMATFGWLVAEEARRMRDALAATQMALAREQRVSALGGLAAAAAHELGSPLSTIAVIAKELAREVPTDSEIAEDVRLLQSETERCRLILARLANQPDTSGHAPFARQPLSAVIEEAAAPYARDAIDLLIERADAEGNPPVGEEPMLPRTPEVMHGLGNLLQNATQFARSTVEVRICWDETSVLVEIHDDGPGFPPAMLPSLGEPFLSSRAGEQGHMGLGIFIAQTLLGRTGATLGFTNLAGEAGSGALITVRWAAASLR